MKCPHCKVDPVEVAEHTKNYMIDVLERISLDEVGREFMEDFSCPACGNSSCRCPSKFN